MRFDIQLSGSAIQGLNAASAKMPRAIEQGLDRAATVVLQQKQRQVSVTYKRAIPRRKKSGKPYWKRSGDFQRGQAIQASPGQRLILTANQAARYERRLSRLPNSPIDGVNRSNPAAENTVRIVQPQIGPVFEQEVRNALGL
jgi:hypothetical protein